MVVGRIVLTATYIAMQRLSSPIVAAALSSCLLLQLAACGSPYIEAERAIASAIDGRCRTPENKQRDIYRHPADTLALFSVQPDSAVLEITPGFGWYTEILAPLLRARGRYVAAIYAPDSNDAAPNELLSAFRDKVRASPECFDRSEVLLFDLAAPSLGAASSMDRVLTFRNAHNWEDIHAAENMFRAIAEVLKPGGYLGVTDHRANPDDSVIPRGYIRESRVIELAQRAGLDFIDSSEVNANPRDRKNYPVGVWALPPTLALGATDAATYRAIGESDRMTLLFRKPTVESPQPTH